MPGVQREVGIYKAVDYALFIEMRDGYLQSKVSEIKDAIIGSF